MSKLITALDVARRDGFDAVGTWLVAKSTEAAQRGRIRAPFDGCSVSGLPVMAYVDFGRWCARCECGSGAYVCPDEPIIFCLKCGNGGSGMARPVLFPVDLDDIEDALLARPVIEHAQAKDEIEAARLARPRIPGLMRNWHASKTLAMLLAENQRLIPGGE